MSHGIASPCSLTQYATTRRYFTFQAVYVKLAELSLQGRQAAILASIIRWRAFRQSHQPHLSWGWKRRGQQTGGCMIICHHRHCVCRCCFMAGPNISEANQVIRLDGGLDALIRCSGSPSTWMIPKRIRAVEARAVFLQVLSRLMCKWRTWFKVWRHVQPSLKFFRPKQGHVANYSHLHGYTCLIDEMLSPRLV